MAMERREEIQVPIGFFDTIENCTIDIISKQKLSLRCPLSRSLAFWGVCGLSLGHFPEVSKEGYGWY